MPVNNPHDRFFKATFSEKDIATAYLREFMDPAIIKDLNIDALAIEGNSYINIDLEEHFSDLVYRCPYSEGDQGEAWITFLFEHKSYPVDFIYLQLLKYIIGIWEDLIKQEQPLRVVIPIIVYHGKEGWNKRKMEASFHLPNEHLKKYLPIFEYNLTDLSAVTDEQILQIRENTKLLNAFMALKHSRDIDFVIEKLGLVLEGAQKYANKQSGKNYFYMIIVYLISTSGGRKKEFLNSVRNLKPNLKSNVMTIYEQIIQEGEIKGKIEGKIEGKLEEKNETTIRMIQNDFDTPTIMLALNVSEEFVETLRKQTKA